MSDADPRLRVLQVVGGLNVGGTETWLVKGFPGLRDHEYRFDFLVHGDGPQHYAVELEAQGARVLRCPEARNIVSYTIALFSLLRRNRYRAVHAHTYCFSGIVLAVAALAGVPIRVFQSHTAQDESHAGLLRRTYFRAARWLIRLCSTRGIAVSEEAARAFFPLNWREHPEQWCIAPVGIDLAPFRQPSHRAEVRAEWNVHDGSRVAIHVGRFAAVKNHALLVDAALSLLERDPRWVFVCVGDGPTRQGIADRVRALGMADRFRFTGVRGDVPRLLQAADVFVLPSHYEGFPLAYLEAQAAGLPCVVSSVIAAAAELVPGRTWRRDVQDSPNAWADALQDAAGLPRQCEVPAQMETVSVRRSMQCLLECYR